MADPHPPSTDDARVDELEQALREIEAILNRPAAGTEQLIEQADEARRVANKAVTS